MLLSICIPTYNRPNHLVNCLNSIFISKQKTNFKFEVCISDNGSRYNLKKIISRFKNKLNIKFHRNNTNQGYGLNLLKVISMAQGEFVWVIGDDDLLVPIALKKIKNLFLKNKDVDFFYINSFHLDSKFLKNFPSPFNTNNLPRFMNKMSLKEKSQKMQFWDLVDYNISFDFMLGNYLNIFKRNMWLQNLEVINFELLKDKRPWSNFDNTCLHLKVYARAFKSSKVYFQARPLSVNLHGVREWHLLYPFIETFKLSEVLDYYRSQGLNLFKYLLCKNYTLRNFFSSFIKIIIGGKKRGLHYINFKKHIIKNLIFPNLYLSLFYLIFRKINKLLMKNN
jgi:glycosyltransferase involved in cell wall biosynthesis